MTVSITPADVAAWLGSGKRKTTNKFLKDFDKKTLAEALKDKGKPIDIKWYVKQLLKALDSADKATERVQVLDRFRELMLLGAIQEEELARYLQSGKASGKRQKIFDPFAGKNLKLKGA